MTEVWYTATTAVDLVATTGRQRPDLRRYVGVVYVPQGRYYNVKRYANADGDVLPRGCKVIYQTRPRINANDAYEQARRVTVHHNLYHDGSQWAGMPATVIAHNRYRCREGRVQVTFTPRQEGAA